MNINPRNSKIPHRIVKSKNLKYPGFKLTNGLPAILRINNRGAIMTAPINPNVTSSFGFLRNGVFERIHILIIPHGRYAGERYRISGITPTLIFIAYNLGLSLIHISEPTRPY